MHITLHNIYATINLGHVFVIFSPFFFSILILMGKLFYVCSYGGSGSTILCKYLKNFGDVRHIHSRVPPKTLEFVGKEKGGDAYGEWFNGVEIEKKRLKKNMYYVIYIYRNPIKAIYSRFRNPFHLDHIQVVRTTTIQDVIEKKQDLYGIRDFYNNYMLNAIVKNGKTIPKRNYSIICIKYEDLFDNLDELHGTLGIIPEEVAEVKQVFKMEKQETEREYPEYDSLYEIYKDLIEEMNKNNFIELR
jgi:hypothetical protein